MRNSRFGAGLLAVVSFGAAMVLTSCSCKIKDEQLASIQRLRTEERQMTADIETAERNKSRVSGELSARQGEVRNCNERKAFVQDKLNKFPAMWPDWDPNAQPAPEPAPEEAKKVIKKR